MKNGWLLIKKHWIIASIAATVGLTVLFNESLKSTFIRRQSIQKSNQELLELSQNIRVMREKISRLQNDNRAYEQLVRSELGYLRPGEKEIRFLSKPDPLPSKD